MRFFSIETRDVRLPPAAAGLVRMIPESFRDGAVELRLPAAPFDGGRIEHLARSVKMADPAAGGTILAIPLIPQGSFREPLKVRCGTADNRVEEKMTLPLASAPHDEPGQHPGRGQNGYP